MASPNFSFYNWQLAATRLTNECQPSAISPLPKTASAGIKIIKVNKVPSDGSASGAGGRGWRPVSLRLPPGALATKPLLATESRQPVRRLSQHLIGSLLEFWELKGRDSFISCLCVQMLVRSRMLPPRSCRAKLHES